MAVIGIICPVCKKYYSVRDHECVRFRQCPGCVREDKSNPKYSSINTDLVNNERYSRNLGVPLHQWNNPKERARLQEIHPGATFRQRGKYMVMEIANRAEKRQRIKERARATGMDLVESD